jgi:hypothetical protein
VLLALIFRFIWPTCAKPVGYVVVALWVVGPPFWFWAEWSFFSHGLPEEDLEDIKHSHELGRNVWLALVVLLTALFGIAFPGTGD